MSIHTNKSREIARGRGGAAASEEAYQLWSLPRREMVEIMLHLAAMCTDSYDDALTNGGAVERVLEERRVLYSNGLL